MLPSSDAPDMRRRLVTRARRRLVTRARRRLVTRARLKIEHLTSHEGMNSGWDVYSKTQVLRFL